MEQSVDIYYFLFTRRQTVHIESNEERPGRTVFEIIVYSGKDSQSVFEVCS